ncbi:MAG: hypothetical protein EA409_09750 [Saprospirales bacterium]|nr:MAG: hypothetical protein EA409_09750 [Saprospirales bacterium]
MNADAFVSHMTNDVVFKFGNTDLVRGMSNVEEVVVGFLRLLICYAVLKKLLKKTTQLLYEVK